MSDDSGRLTSFRESETALRERLINLPRASKQFLMFLVDAAGQRVKRDGGFDLWVVSGLKVLSGPIDAGHLVLERIPLQDRRSPGAQTPRKIRPWCISLVLAVKILVDLIEVAEAVADTAWLDPLELEHVEE